MDNPAQLKQRVIHSAEAALATNHHVSAIDVLMRMGLLAPRHLMEWKRGQQFDFLEQAIQAGAVKVSRSLALFHEWAREKGLSPTEISYVRDGRAGTVDLRFTESGDPDIERLYRTNYVSATLPERKQKSLTEKLNRPNELVVFDNLRDSQCTECGAELPEGSFLFMEAGQPLCLPCARLDNLEFLPAGDAALTRRSTKYSAKKAVVVRFSKSRGRYERQGVLVDPAAVQKAEEECSEDAEQRAKARAAGAVRREKEDRMLTVRMAEQIQKLLPNCPPQEAAAIAEHTAKRGSGRVGRTAEGRNLEEGALKAAVIAAIRHRFTDYDALLASGVERNTARQQVAERIDDMFRRWGG